MAMAKGKGGVSGAHAQGFYDFSPLFFSIIIVVVSTSQIYRRQRGGRVGSFLKALG